MKPKMLLYLVVLFTAVLVSCNDEDEKARKGDPDVTHEGEQWNIQSIDYTLVDQTTSGSGIGTTYKTDVKENVGTFYFKNDTEGSFEFNVEGYNKEDYFEYGISGDEISIFTIEQNVGSEIGQNIISLSGAAGETERTLSGTIIKQSTTGQFMITVDIVLKKK